MILIILKIKDFQNIGAKEMNAGHSPVIGNNLMLKIIDCCKRCYANV